MSKRILFFEGCYISDRWVSDRWRFLFYALIDRFGFKHSYDKKEISEAELIFAIASPRKLLQWNDLGLFENANTKIIIHSHDYYLRLLRPGHKEYLGRLSAVIKKCDIHLSPGDLVFKKVFPEHMKKHVFFPYFFATKQRYTDLKFNENPTIKCLFSGHISKLYGVRRKMYFFIKSGQPGSEIFDMLEWPGHFNAKKKESVVGTDYAQLLNQYLCSITTTAFSHPVAKHFEIMASGSLLISNETEDLKTLGMIPGKHYIAVTFENFIEKTQDCLANPKKYRQIRLTGMEYARTNHSIENRLSSIRRIIKKLEA